MSSAESIVPVVVEIVSTWGLRVVGAIAFLIVGRIVAASARRWTRSALERSRTDATLIPFAAGLVYYLLLAFVVIAVLGIFGVPTASFVAVIGALGLAVGLAMQGTLSNFAAGAMLLLFRPFKVGDWVEAAGVAGTVREIGIFTTTLASADNVQVIVPNSQVYGHVIRNYWGYDTRRVDLVVGISYGDDIERAISAVRQVLEADARVLSEPAPVVAVADLGDSSVDLVVRPWCKVADYWPLRFELTRRIKEGLEAGGCTIPYPQRDVHLHGAADATP